MDLLSSASRDLILAFFCFDLAVKTKLELEFQCTPPFPAHIAPPRYSASIDISTTLKKQKINSCLLKTDRMITIPL